MFFISWIFILTYLLIFIYFFWALPNLKAPFERKIQTYEIMKQYHSDELLKDYPIYLTITNKHFIDFDPEQINIEQFNNIDTSEIYMYKKEFCFYNLNRLTVIDLRFQEKRDIIYLNFDIPEHNLTKENVPRIVLFGLSKEDIVDMITSIRTINRNFKQKSE